LIALIRVVEIAFHLFGERRCSGCGCDQGSGTTQSGRSRTCLEAGRCRCATAIAETR